MNRWNNPPFGLRFGPILGPHSGLALSKVRQHRVEACCSEVRPRQAHVNERAALVNNAG